MVPIKHDGATATDRETREDVLRVRQNQGVERGLYVCEACDAPFNADVNGAENIRLTINKASNSESSTNAGEDRSTGWLARPGVYLHD